MRIEIDKAQLRQAMYGRRREICTVMDIVESTLWRKVTGRRRMTLDDLCDICEVLNEDPLTFIRRRT